MAAEGSWQGLQEQYQLQDAPAAALRAQLASEATAAAQSWEGGSSEVLRCMELLAACIELGEAVQLQQEQAVSWRFLQQLAAAQPTSGAAAEQGPSVTSDIWQLLQAWGPAVTAVVPAARQPEQQQGTTEGATQMLPAQWQQLVSALDHLQQQVQEALPQPEQQQLLDPLQKAPAGTSTAAAAGLTAAAGSAPPYKLLQRLCKTVPVLLQPADLEDCWVETAPSSMARVTLLRLAAATSRLWLPQLEACSSSAVVTGPAGAVGTTATGSTTEQTPQPERLVQHLPLGSSKDVKTAAIWQPRPAEQVAAELGSAAPTAVVAAGAAAGKGNTLALRWGMRTAQDGQPFAACVAVLHVLLYPCKLMENLSRLIHTIFSTSLLVLCDPCMPRS